MSKKITIKPKPLQKNNIPDDIENKIDQWITGEKQHETKKIKFIRLNFNIEQEKHLKLKMLCLKKNVTIKEFLLNFISEELKKEDT